MSMSCTVENVPPLLSWMVNVPSSFLVIVPINPSGCVDHLLKTELDTDRIYMLSDFWELVYLTLRGHIYLEYLLAIFA